MIIMVIRTTTTHGTDRTLKLYSPGNLCRAASAILAMISSIISGETEQFLLAPKVMTDDYHPPPLNGKSFSPRKLGGKNPLSSFLTAPHRERLRLRSA